MHLRTWAALLSIPAVSWCSTGFSPLLSPPPGAAGAKGGDSYRLPYRSSKNTLKVASRQSSTANLKEGLFDGADKEADKRGVWGIRTHRDWEMEAVLLFTFLMHPMFHSPFRVICLEALQSYYPYLHTYIYTLLSHIISQGQSYRSPSLLGLTNDKFQKR